MTNVIQIYFLGPQSLELKDFYARATTDVIASTAFGLKVDTLKDKENLFYKMGNEFQFGGFMMVLKTFAFLMAPKIMKVYISK